MSIRSMITVGETITVLSQVGEELIPEHGQITNGPYESYWGGSHGMWFSWRNAEGEKTSAISLNSEGTRWIRGHHPRESEAVQALLVALALVRTT